MKKKTTKPLAFAKDFMETTTILQVDPTDFLQLYINRMDFLTVYRVMPLLDQKNRGQMLIWKMDGQKKTGDSWAQTDVCQMGFRFLNVILGVMLNHLFTEAQQKKAVAEIMQEWEEEVTPFLGFTLDISLQNGKKLDITFNFLLFSLLMNSNPEAMLVKIMKASSLAYIDAALHMKGGQVKSTSEVLYEDFLSSKHGLFGAKVKPQYEIPEKFQLRYNELKERMAKIKSFDERLAGYTAFYKAWYKELVID